MTSALGKAISSHPGFKYAVGLWFAAFLGFSVFVQPGTNHDILSKSLGLAAILPAAEPPVGLAGRAALAAIAALLGLLLGLVIAQRIALAHALEDENEADWEQAPDDQSERSVWLDDAAHPSLAEQPRAHRVFNPREDIDEDGIAGPPPADPWPEDAIDEQAEDEDALMQAWREERGPADEQEPELAEEAAGIAIFDEIEEEAGPFPDPPFPAAEETAEVPEAWAEIETENLWDEPAPEPELEPTPEPEPAPAPAPRSEAFGDMSLDALTARLGQALAEARARDAQPAAPSAAEPQHEEESDPVIAFLRREAGRNAPGTDSAPGLEGDPQTVLRSALDKLSRVSNPK